MSGTPSHGAWVRNQVEQRERQWQTSFPAKVLSWDSTLNTVHDDIAQSIANSKALSAL
jgi:hypothetical protein